MHQMDQHDAAYDDALVTEVIRPAAIVPEEAARVILVELSMNSVHVEGHWLAEPSRWSRYDRPWTGDGEPGEATLVGTISGLTDEALGFGGLSLDQCPRAAMHEPPKPFRF